MDTKPWESLCAQSNDLYKDYIVIVLVTRATCSMFEHNSKIVDSGFRIQHRISVYMYTMLFSHHDS